MSIQEIWKKSKRMLALLLAVTLFFSGWGNYDFSVMAAGELSIELEYDSKTYTGNEITLPAIQSVKSGLDEIRDYELSGWECNDAPINDNKVTEAGTYVITATKQAETSLKLTGTAAFTVKELDLTECTIEAEDVYYTGEPVTAANVTVKIGEEIVNPEVYDIKYADNTEIGTATIKIVPKTGNGSVTGEKTDTFEIKGKEIPLKADMVSISPQEGIIGLKDYSKEIQITVKDGETILTKGIDYTVEIPQMLTEGSYKIQVTGKGNYTGNVNKEFELSYSSNGTVTLEGQTFEDNVYVGEVIVKPKEDYNISESPDGKWKDEITYAYEDSDKIPESVYLKNKETGNISKIPLEKFTIINTKPTIKLAENISNEAWRNQVTIKLSVENASYVYYAIEDKIKDGVNKKSDLNGLKEMEESDSNYTLTIQDNISEEKIYYFYAIDQAGQVAKLEVAVDKIDAEKPTISAKCVNYDEKDNKYWKNSKDLEIEISVEESLSGIKSLSLEPDQEQENEGAKLDAAIEDGKLLEAAKLTVKEAGQYTLTIEDEAGNSAELLILVKQDEGKPELKEVIPQAVTSEGKTGNLCKTADVYWLDNNTVQFLLSVTKETENEFSPYIVKYFTGEDMMRSKKHIRSHRNERIKANLGGNQNGINQSNISTVKGKSGGIDSFKQ